MKVTLVPWGAVDGDVEGTVMVVGATRPSPRRGQRVHSQPGGFVTHEWMSVECSWSEYAELRALGVHRDAYEGEYFPISRVYYDAEKGLCTYSRLCRNYHSDSAASRNSVPHSSLTTLTPFVEKVQVPDQKVIVW